MAEQRLAVINGHLSSNSGTANGKTTLPKVPSTVPRHRQELLTWNGWGYKDSGFKLERDAKGKPFARFRGSRYELGNTDLPHFFNWIYENMGLDPEHYSAPRPPAPTPPPTVNEAFVEDLKKLGLAYSFDGDDRLFRAHGHTLHDISTLRTGMFPRIPDVVVWPECHEQVRDLMPLAVRHNVAVIPVGGGTNVTGALDCSSIDVARMIVSLDTSQMNQILWIDEANMQAQVEAGIIGQDLEQRLQQRGFTTGHEPDSYEFSSLGGWVATRASGMKKNRYGNIEDLVVALRAVTPAGEWQSTGKFPRVSTGPSMDQVLLGSEGTLGVITEVTIKLRPVPPVRKYASFVFADFETGFRFMRQVALERCQPASLRMMDNEQFKFGQALRPASGPFSFLTDGLKHFYLTRLKGLDPDKIVVATIVMEGTAKEVAVQEDALNVIGAQHGGIPGGENNGKRGYQLTFVIAYIRDVGLDHGMVAESFETSAPWDKVLNVVNNTKHVLKEQCIKRGFSHYFISARVTQVYDAGACIYFYFGFNYGCMPIAQAVHEYEDLETVAREEIMASGGSLSHHHGVGKIRKKWLPSILSESTQTALKSIKTAIDPQNVMATGNLLF